MERVRAHFVKRDWRSCRPREPGAQLCDPPHATSSLCPVPECPRSPCVAHKRDDVRGPGPPPAANFCGRGDSNPSASQKLSDSLSCFPPLAGFFCARVGHPVREIPSAGRLPRNSSEAVPMRGPEAGHAGWASMRKTPYDLTGRRSRQRGRPVPGRRRGSVLCQPDHGALPMPHGRTLC